jgi:hypothetical protein
VVYWNGSREILSRLTGVLNAVYWHAPWGLLPVDREPHTKCFYNDFVYRAPGADGAMASLRNCCSVELAVKDPSPCGPLQACSSPFTDVYDQSYRGQGCEINMQ